MASNGVTFALTALLLLASVPTANAAGRALRASRVSREGLSCYPGNTFDKGELSACADGEDICFLRYRVDPFTDQVLGDVSRYCTAKSTCPQSDSFTTHETAEGAKYVARCCSSEGCNGGVPAVVPAGLYWIKSTEGQYTTLGVSAKTMDGFHNTEMQRWEVSSVGDKLEGKVTIVSEGVAASDKATVWTIEEVGEGEYSVFMSTTKDTLVKGVDKYVLVPTVSWEVGWEGKECPAGKTKLVPSANTVAACQEACMKSGSGCEEAFEWGAEKKTCKLLIGGCAKDDTSGGSDVMLYKSKCAGVICQALDQCHQKGICDLTTGTCSNPNMADDSGCDDQNDNTVQDKCFSGKCAGVDLCAEVTCPPPGQCFSQGICDKHSGKCDEIFKAGGASCDDGDDNTVDDVCNAGTCQGTDLCESVSCEAKDQCHATGTCNHMTGTCDQPLLPMGTSCDDGDRLTINDKCMAGICEGRGRCEDIKCTIKGPCFKLGECDPESGTCSDPFNDDGTKCDDESPITVNDVCSAGQCMGEDLCAEVVCVADESPSSCSDVGSCDHATGKCPELRKPDNSECDDGDAKTVEDVCTAGTCKGKDLCEGVTCEAQSQCHAAGECASETGLCSNPYKDNQASCDDGDAFTENDVCVAGICAGTQIVEVEVETPEEELEHVVTPAVMTEINATVTKLVRESVLRDCS